MPREKALGIALGNINPITGEVIANFSPCKTKVSNSLLGERLRVRDFLNSKLCSRVNQRHFGGKT